MTGFFGSGSTAADIAQLEQAGDISSLIRLLSSTDPAAQWHAAEALGRCGERAVPLLLEALESRSVPVRLGAIEALGTIRDKRVVLPLLAVLHREASLEVRWAAVLALGEIGSSEAIPALVPLLKDANRYIRHGAAITLGRLGWQPKTADENVNLLVARDDWESVRHLGTLASEPLLDLIHTADPATRELIISVLAQNGDLHAQAVCREALKDPNSHVRWKAVLAAMNCGLASHDLPIMVAARKRTGPDPAAAALLNFLFFGIGYNYLGKWWGYPVFMTYMSVLVLAQLALGPFLPFLIAYPVTALMGIHTYYAAQRMSDL